MDNKIIELETKIAYQDDLIESLNEVVAKQQQDIIALQIQMQKLIEELKEALRDLQYGNGAGGLGEDERPPHY